MTVTLYRFYLCTLGPIARYLFTPEVKGVENIPRKGPAIIASNHLAVIDDALIPLVTPRMVHFMGKQDYFTGKGLKGKLKKFFFTTAGVFPVDRSGGQNSLGGLLAAKKVLEEGKLFGIHPEGTRSPDGKLYKGHTGVARLAYETGAPIIPVALTGTDIAQPKGTVWPHRHHTTVTFGKPIYVSRLPENEITHEKIRELTDRMMHEIQKLSKQPYVDMYAQDRKKELLEQSRMNANEKN